MLKMSRETMTKEINLYILSMHKRRILFEIISWSKNNSVQKNKNSDYIFFKVYKSITLLYTMNKMLKSIMINKITKLAKKNLLLLNSQISAKRKKKIETTLKMLTEKIHAIWKQNKNKMIIIMSVNVTKTYDHVSHIRLLHNLKKKKNIKLNNLIN